MSVYSNSNDSTTRFPRVCDSASSVKGSVSHTNGNKHSLVVPVIPARSHAYIQILKPNDPVWQIFMLTRS